MKLLHLIIAISLINFIGLVTGIIILRPYALASPLAQPLPSPTVPIISPTFTVAKPTAPPPTPDNRCLVQIDGLVYDLTTFRTIHSGGNIFQCGSDMSSIFHNQHPADYLNQLARYRL